MALEIQKMPIYGVRDILKLSHYGVGNLQNTRFMALGIQKNADLWRWGYGKMPIYGVRGTLKLPHYGVRNLQNT